MTDSQPDQSQDFTPTEEQIYQSGRYDMLAELSELLQEMMGEIAIAHPTLAPAYELHQSDQRVLDEPIASLGISNRALNILTRKKIHTIRELTKHSEVELLEYRGMGPETVADIQVGLMRIGQTLRDA